MRYFCAAACFLALFISAVVSQYNVANEPYPDDDVYDFAGANNRMAGMNNRHHSAGGKTGGKRGGGGGGGGPGGYANF